MPTPRQKFKLYASRAYPDKWRIVEMSTGKTVDDDLTRAQALKKKYAREREQK